MNLEKDAENINKRNLSKKKIKKKKSNKCKKQHKICSKKNATFIDFKKLIKIFKSKFEIINKMDSAEIKLLEEKINKLDEVEGEHIIIDNLSSMMANTDSNNKLSLKDVKEMLTKFKSNNDMPDKDISNCESLYKDQTEIEDKDSWDDTSKNYKINRIK